MSLPATVWLGAAATASALPVLWWAVSAPRTSAGRTRLLPQTTDLRNMSLARPASERLTQPALEALARLGHRITPTGAVARLERKLAMAAAHESWTVERVLATRMLLAGMLGMLGMLRWAGEPGRLDLLLLTAGLAGVGYMLPTLVIDRRARARMDTVANQLPDVLDQITISVEAGLGFEAALAHVAKGVDGPVGEEFRRTLHDIRLGMTRDQAFGALAARTDVEELQHFVISLQQAEKLGIPIADVLRAQSAELRVVRRQRAEESAQKLPVKMIFPLILCILPALVLVTLAPAVFEFFDNFPTGD